MLVYIPHCILDILFNIIAYLTNPIVVLFANEVGELPAIFTWWANWDDGLDIDWMVDEGIVPKIFCYDFHRHYKYHSPQESMKIRGIYVGYVDLLDPNFTLWERVQRYFCRLWWIYRNCAYGWSYYVTGKVIDGSKVITVRSDRSKGNDYFGYYKYWLTHEPFCYFLETNWNPKNISWLKWTGIDHTFCVKVFLGWKFQYIKSTETKRAMLVIFAWPFRSPI